MNRPASLLLPPRLGLAPALRLTFPLATGFVALLAAPSAQAAIYYWDGNNSSANFASASGTWAAPTIGTATAGWSTSSAGTTVVLANSVTTTTGDALHFGTDTASRGLGTGTITVSGTVEAASLRFGSITTGNVTLSGGVLNLAAVTSIHVGAGGGTVHTISSNITGAATSLTKTGNSLTLSGANSYTGSTLISTGTLTLGSTGALGSTPGVDGTSGITIGGAAAATLASTLTGITIAAPITTANTGINSTISFSRATSAQGSLTLNGAIGGNGNVVFTTPNVSSGGNLQTINLGAAGTYAGSTTISTGNINNTMTVKAGVTNALPSATVLTVDGGNGPASATTRVSTYDLGGFNQTLAGLTNNTTRTQRNQRVSNSGTLATLTINNTADFSYGSTVVDAATSTASITGTLNLVKNGSGTQTLTGAANSFTGSTTILGGILSLGHSGSLQNSPLDTAASVTGDASNGLRTTVTTLTLGGLTGNKNLADVFTHTSGGFSALTALTLNPASGATPGYSGVIADGAVGTTLTKTGLGTQTLSALNTYTGGTTVNAGTLTAGHISAFGDGAITVNAAGTLNLGGFAVGNAITNNDGTITGASGSATITQSGGTINGSLGGTVTASGTVAGSPTFTGTLKGTATFAGAVTMADGSVHAPGSSPGSQTFALGLSYDGLATLEWDFVGDTLLTPGTNFDAVLVTGGDLTITSGATLKLIAATVNYAAPDWDVLRVFSVVDFTSPGTSTGVFTILDLTQAGSFGPQGGWSVANSGGDILLTWTPVPEPSTYAALAGLAVLGLAWKRRRNPNSLR